MKPNAMDEVYRKYHKELYLYALSLCRNDHLAMDLVNETFYKAFITSNHSDASFKYWLFKVLKNLFIDSRRKNRESLTMETHKDFMYDSPDQGPTYRYLLKERDQKLYLHLMRLEPEIYREVLTLYYYGRMSIKEIASTKGLTETNMKTILYRARKKLGKALKEDPYEF